MAADDTSTPSRAIVHYRSSALESVKHTMGILGDRSNSDVMKCPGVIAAAEVAERAREQFKLSKLPSNSNRNPILSSGVDGGGIDKAERYDRRTKLNRHSAAASRLRKEAYIQALEQQLLLHDDRNKQLESDLREERASRLKLQGDLESLESAANMVAPLVPMHPVDIDTMKLKQEDVNVNTGMDVSDAVVAPSAEVVAIEVEVPSVESTDAISPYYLADTMGDLGIDDLEVPLEPFPFDLLDEGR